MKLRYLVLILIFTVNIVGFSQGPRPPRGRPTPLPISSGLVILVTAAVIYGIKENKKASL